MRKYWSQPADRQTPLSKEASQVHSQAIVIDLHVDWLLQCRFFGYDPKINNRGRRSFGSRALPFDLVRYIGRLRDSPHPFFNHADIPRMIDGGYNAAALGIHAWPRQHENGWEEANRQLDIFDTLIASDDRLIQAKTPDDIRRAAKCGQLALFPLIEGVHALGSGGKKTEKRRLDRLEQLFERGVRTLTLVHFSKNDVAAHGFGIGATETVGITPFGKELILKLNEIGIIIDVAHVNQRGVADACRYSKRPVIASHTGLCSSLPSTDYYYYSRLLEDRALNSIAESGGSASLIFSPSYLGQPRGDSRLLAEHLTQGIDFLDRRGFRGIDHFGFGSDFDGWIPDIPNDMKDVADAPVITQTLLGAGFSVPDIHKIWGGNFLRIWERVLGN